MARPKAEIGASGLPMWSGRLSLDPNPRLRWPAAGKIYRDMDNNEPAVGALRQAIHTLLRSDVQVQPGGKTRQDQRAADHVADCLDDLRQPFGTKVRQMASAYFYGFSVSEVVYKRRPDGLVGWADFAFRRQESFERWETKGTQVVAFTQRPAPDYVLRTIPLIKALHLVTDDSDGSPEGRGVLRGMYRYWYMCCQFEILAGIALERFGTGMPIFERTEDVVLTPEQEDNLGEQAESIRQNEQAYMLLPKGLKFAFAPSPGLNAQTYLDFIRAYRIWMLSVGLAEFIALGSSETGSYALGSTKVALFQQALTGLQNKICDTINRQAIPRLMALNGFRVTKSPTVSLPAIRDYDLGALGSFLSVLHTVGAFHATPVDEEWFRKITDLADLTLPEIEKLHADAQAQEAKEARQAVQSGPQSTEAAPAIEDTGVRENGAGEPEEELVEDDGE